MLNSEHLSLILHMHFSFLGFFSPSVRITVVFLVSEPTQKIEYFVFLYTILLREITHLELKHYHKLLEISDCYRCHERVPVAMIEVSKFGLWRREFCFQTSKVRLSSQFMLCWVESVKIQIKVHIFQ